MARADRQTIPSLIRLGEDEEFTYTVDTTPYGGTPLNVDLTAYDITGRKREDVTTTIITSGPTVVADDISYTVANLTPGHVYRVEVLFESGGNTAEPYTIFLGEH